jgi:hypothetical protein
VSEEVGDRDGVGEGGDDQMYYTELVYVVVYYESMK